MQFNELLKKGNDWFDQPRFQASQVFCAFIYSWVVLNALTLLPHHRYFWGDLSWVQKLPMENGSPFYVITNLLSYDSVGPYYFFFILLQIFFSVLRIFGKLSTLSSLAVWLLTLNLDNKIFTTMDGGNNLIHLMLFYSIFMFPEGSKKSKWIDLIKKYSVNSSLLMARIQLCIVYFVAGHLKMTGEYWTNGMAFYYVFGVDEYSLPMLNDLFKSFPLISVLASYMTILFQISLPFLIWVREARPLLFFIGGFMHLGIAFGMGLFTFGFAMIVCYSVFFTPKQVEFYYSLAQHLKLKCTLLRNAFVQKWTHPLTVEEMNEGNF